MAGLGASSWSSVITCLQAGDVGNSAARSADDPDAGAYRPGQHREMKPRQQSC
jgi:hypothetical protein